MFTVSLRSKFGEVATTTKNPIANCAMLSTWVGDEMLFLVFLMSLEMSGVDNGVAFDLPVCAEWKAISRWFMNAQSKYLHPSFSRFGKCGIWLPSVVLFPGEVISKRLCQCLFYRSSWGKQNISPIPPESIDMSSSFIVSRLQFC